MRRETRQGARPASQGSPSSILILGFTVGTVTVTVALAAGAMGAPASAMADPRSDPFVALFSGSAFAAPPERVAAPPEFARAAARDPPSDAAPDLVSGSRGGVPTEAPAALSLPVVSAGAAGAPGAAAGDAGAALVVARAPTSAAGACDAVTS